MSRTRVVGLAICVVALMLSGSGTQIPTPSAHGSTSLQAASGILAHAPHPSAVDYAAPTPSQSSPLWPAPRPAAPSSIDFAWSTARPPSSGALVGPGLAADPARQEAVLFGGANGTALANGTWVYNESNGTWRNIQPPLAPSPRSDFAFAGNSATQTAPLFGGLINASTGRVGADTWLYNFSAGTWTNVTGGAAPPARQDPAFAIAPTLSEAVLYGGWDRNSSGRGTFTYGDGWRLNLTTFVWSPLPTRNTVHPPALQGASLSWDSSRGQFELFGGCFPCVTGIWLYNPSTENWSEPPIAGTAPTPRASPVWAYDPAQDRDLLFGGIGNGGPLTDTYEWDPVSGNWTAQVGAVHPPGRYAAAATWMDVTSNETLLVTGGAGLNTPTDLWRLAAVGNLSILVLNGSSFVPVPKATVTVDGTTSAFTDAHGYLNLTRVTPQLHAVGAVAPGYAHARLSVWIPPGNNARLLVNLTPVPPANLTVRVLNLDGMPVAGATVGVILQGSLFLNPPLVTDATGVVNYTGIPSFPVNVTASAPGYRPNALSVDLFPGVTTHVQILLTSFALAFVQVRGYLPTVGYGLPLFAAHVSAGPLVRGLTDLHGNAFLQMDVQGLIGMTASAPGFFSLTLLENAPPTGVFLVNFTLTSLPFGTLNIRVLDADTRAPIPQAAVNLTAAVGSPINGFAEFGVTGNEGTLNGSYPPCNYSLEVSHIGYYTNTSHTQLRIFSDAVRSLTVNLTPVKVAPGPGRNNTTAPGENGSFYLLPPAHPVAWPFLVVPVLLLLAGGTYLALLHAEPPTRRPIRAIRRVGRLPPPLEPRAPPPPPSTE
ncbi:MAG: hypothetical protein L3K14_05010 [Thermoplasmata archaeon]|nr:hypothetical protein [Thermoplasmata archaeon]